MESPVIMIVAIVVLAYSIGLAARLRSWGKNLPHEKEKVDAIDSVPSVSGGVETARRLKYSYLEEEAV